MCLSRIGQILYGITMFVALSLTIAGMLTPGWRQLETRLNGTTTPNPLDPDAVSKVKQTVNVGLFSFACTVPGELSTTNAKSGKAAGDYCEEWWKDRPTWEKIVIGLLILAVLGEIIALVYNFVTFCCCCFRGHALKPLAPLALLCAIFLGAAIVIFAIKNQDTLKQNKTFGEFRDSTNIISYSFFLECGALVLLIVNVCIGSITVCLGDKCL